MQSWGAVEPDCLSYTKNVWRYRLTVRTEPSQGLNTGSIPVSATNSSYTYRHRAATLCHQRRPKELSLHICLPVLDFRRSVPFLVLFPLLDRFVVLPVHRIGINIS